VSRYQVAQIAGDGIGPEVIAEAVRVLEAVETDGLRFSLEPAEVGAGLYRRTGEDLPRETVDLCRAVDAILCGAAGLPDVRHPDGTAALMCRWLGLQHHDVVATRAADRIETAVARALADPRAHTRDLGGAASTRACADAVLDAL